MLFKKNSFKKKKEFIGKIREIQSVTGALKREPNLRKLTRASLKKKGFRGKIFQAQGKSHANPRGKTQSSVCHRTENSSGTIAQRSQAANRKETNLHRYQGPDRNYRVI